MTFKFLGKTGLRIGVNLMCTGASSFFLFECSYVHCKESECSQFTPQGVLVIIRRRKSTPKNSIE